jgi:hypothetical protein
MSDQHLARLLVAAGLVLVGIGFLVYAAWARRGGSPAARAWMGSEFGSRTVDERMSVLGAPVFGVMCLSFAMIVLPVVGKHLALIAVPVGVLAFFPFLWAIMLFIPLPDAIYPRWARPLRERNRRAEAGWKREIRRRSGR